MMERWSPLARRAIAVALLVLLVLLAVGGALVPAAGFLKHELSALEEVRTQVARAIMVRDRTAPPRLPQVPARMYITAPDRRTAGDILAGQVTMLGTRRGLQVEVERETAGQGGAPALLSLTVRVTGDEAAILGFIGDLEHGSPLARFRSLQLVQAAPGPVAGAAAASFAAGNAPAPLPAGEPPDTVTAPPAPPASPQGPVANPTASLPPAALLSLSGTLIALWGAQG